MATGLAAASNVVARAKSVRRGAGEERSIDATPDIQVAALLLQLAGATTASHGCFSGPLGLGGLNHLRLWLDNRAVGRPCGQ
jgi:hypothetical protein